MIDYKNKYLKYKLKYLQLKKEIFTRQHSGPSLIVPNSPSKTPPKQTKPKDSLREPSESKKQLKPPIELIPKLSIKTPIYKFITPLMKKITNPLSNAQKIYNIYTKGLAFPEWILNPDNWNSFNFDRTIILYDYPDNINNVVKLVKEREPNNFMMTRRDYNKDALKENFNYTTSYYSTSTEIQLKPNIAIYCYASIAHLEPVPCKKVHIINLVPYIFDDPQQPDYIYYKNKKDNGENIIDDLILKYRKVWLKACIIATYLKLNKIIIYNVGYNDGTGKYSKLLTEFNITNFTEQIFHNSFSNQEIHPNIITPQSYCQSNNIIIEYAFNIVTGEDYEESIPPPKYIFKLHDDELNKILFVNACNPHTILGNYNNFDSTINGFWGRKSNISVLGWGMTNDKIKYMKITY